MNEIKIEKGDKNQIFQFDNSEPTLYIHTKAEFEFYLKVPKFIPSDEPLLEDIAKLMNQIVEKHEKKRGNK